MLKPHADANLMNQAWQQLTLLGREVASSRAVCVCRFTYAYMGTLDYASLKMSHLSKILTLPITRDHVQIVH